LTTDDVYPNGTYLACRSPVVCLALWFAFFTLFWSDFFHILYAHAFGLVFFLGLVDRFGLAGMVEKIAAIEIRK
jgi:hypothetical protein